MEFGEQKKNFGSPETLEFSMNITEKFDLCQWIRKAYKKFKSSAYFDRTNAPVRECVIRFESTGDWGEQKDPEAAFQDMAAALSSCDPEIWENYQADILKRIRAFCYPKKLEKERADHFYTTAKNNTVFVEELQYMIDMPIEGHILGVLWILLCGCQIDSALYDRAYANRIRKTLHSELTHEPTYSPHLFEPYFQQYQSWRDSAL